MDPGVWVKAPCDSSACVEVKKIFRSDMVVLRMSDDPGKRLLLSDAEWEAFKAGVKAGVFD